MGSTALSRNDTVFLFDLDGTLTEPRQVRMHLIEFISLATYP